MPMVTRSCKGGHSIHYAERDAGRSDPEFVATWLEQHADCRQPAELIAGAIRDALSPLVAAILEEADRG